MIANLLLSRIDPTRRDAAARERERERVIMCGLTETIYRGEGFETARVARIRGGDAK